MSAEGDLPGGRLLHFDCTARLLPYCSFLTGNSSYFDAFAQSYEGSGGKRGADYWYGTSTLLYIPWLQDRLWNVRLTADGIAVRAVYMGTRTSMSGTICAPDGDVTLSWSGSGHVESPEGVVVETQIMKDIY